MQINVYVTLTVLWEGSNNVGQFLAIMAASGENNMFAEVIHYLYLGGKRHTTIEYQEDLVSCVKS